MRSWRDAPTSGCDVSIDLLTRLDECDWKARQRAHRERVEPWVSPRRDRRRTGRAHPVDDFLFDYYPYSVGKLSTWHPGHGWVLLGEADSFLDHQDYVRTVHGVTADVTRLSAKAERLAFAISLLERTAGRSRSLDCFGMHEWAMVYRRAAGEVRHSSYPLRLTPDDIADVVDEVGLRCTHIDAYRFFTEDAVPRNAYAPTRATQPDFEQPGCLHANMDLYKYAMWFSPFVPSELVADCFELARSARVLDMEAAPYDLVTLGYEPIRVETVEGRREYVTRQRIVADAAQTLREHLLTALHALAAGALDQE
jgi:hypothetical protein